uniref:Uncharacterized protein n=1 Tax=Oryza sativa subsp. japonica TaxID=39947 RepID=Q8W2Y5_ORYSJ|nr:hypothetical protein [Oryza sativa Japonica Group]
MAAVAATTTTTILTAAAMKTTSDRLHRRRHQLLRPQTSDLPASPSNAHPTAAAGSGLHGVLFVKMQIITTVMYIVTQVV